VNGVIYCRVSSKEQVKGTSLESQELVCREYAARHDINVLKVFLEEGESAKFADRTKLLELMDFCSQRDNHVQVLLVWKVDRLARNVGDHFNIKASLVKQGVQVISATEPIDANPEGKLMETILAGFAQFDNDLRAARTVLGMRRRIQEGIYPRKPPFGYKTINQKGSKKTRPDIPDEPIFGLLQKAWKEFATGAYTKAEILRLMNALGIRVSHNRPMPKQSLDEMFRNPFYAGVVKDSWSGEEHVGQHIPLVSSEVFAKVQLVINRRNRSCRHTQLRPEFPLRGFARCAACSRYLTGGFSRGRSKYYPYYHCFATECTNRTNCPTHLLHQEFTAFLSSITPNDVLVERLIELIRSKATHRLTTSRDLSERKAREDKKLQAQEQNLVQMRMDDLLTNEEFRTQKALLLKRRYELEAGGPASPLDRERFLRLIEETRNPLLNLSAAWADFPLAIKPRFQQLVLPTGFLAGRIGTAPMGRLFSTFARSEQQMTALVHQDGQTLHQIMEDLQEFLKLLQTARELGFAS
jgi:site-specific DNA recombinase